MAESENQNLERLANREYQYGFVTEIDEDRVPPGLDESDRAPDLREEGRAGVAARVAAQGAAPLPRAARPRSTSPTWANVRYPKIDYQKIIYYSAPKPKQAREPRRGRSGAAAHLREARHRAHRAEAPRRRRGGRRLRQRLGRHHLQGGARAAGHHLLLVLRGGAALPRAGAPVPRLGRALLRQLLRGAELGGLHRRLLRLRAEGRALPDGALHLLPHQRGGHRAVRAHAAHRRRGRLRLLPRGLHRADARREPAARGGGRAGRARRRRDQVLDGPELVPGRQERQGRHLQLRDQARRLPRPALEDLLDAGGDRLGDHLEVPELHPAGRRLGRRVLLGGDDQQPPAGRHRHEDDPHRQEHALDDRLEGHLGGARPAVVPRPGAHRAEGRERAQLLAVRLAAARRPVRRPHLPVHRGEERHAPPSSTRPPPRRSARTSSSTAGSAGSPRRTRSR